MSEHELEGMEASLSRLRPAAPPPELMRRLMQAQPAPVTRENPASESESVSPWKARPRAKSGTADGLRTLLLRWLAPALGAAALAAVAIVVGMRVHSTRPEAQLAKQIGQGITADDVQINHELVGSFETVANMPGGEPVRLECKRWLDKVVYRDKATGTVIEQETPRLQVVPVGYETY
jgi:hypothetical protein